MALILDEKEYAETNLLKNKKYGNYLKLKDAIVLAKYYRWHQGKDTREIRKILIAVAEKLDKNWNQVKQGWKMDVAIRESKKRKLRVSTPIPVTKMELEIIKKAGDYDLEKVLFVFLVYSKILKYNQTLVVPPERPRLIGTFYVNEKSRNLFSAAGVIVNKKQRESMMHNLYSIGYLDATRYGGFIVKNVFENSPIEFEVLDYDNIILYYQRYCGERVVGCSCGRLFLKKSSNHTYCHICRQNKRIEKWRNIRKNKKTITHPASDPE